MTEEENKITKAYYNYTNRGWPSYKTWEELGDGAKSIWKDRAMREYRKEKNQSS